MDIVLYAKVYRDLSPKEVLDASGEGRFLLWCADPEAIETMPCGNGEKAEVVEVVFFDLDHGISDEDLEREYALRGLVAADPYSLAAINRDNHSFMDRYPNGTHWKNSKGEWCCLIFARWFGLQRVNVFCHGIEDRWCDGGLWFAGLRK